MNLVKIIKKNWVLGLLGGAYLTIYLWQNQIGGFLLAGLSIKAGWVWLIIYLLMFYFVWFLLFLSLVLLIASLTRNQS